MIEERIPLSNQEPEQVSVMEAILDRRLCQREAALQLGRSVRQVKRLVRRYREPGPRGLVSGHRGKTPGNAKAPSVRQAVLALVRERYADFGPTLACEKRAERHDLHLCAETLRR